MKPRFRNLAFLFEVLVNVLVFSLACAVLANVFAKASALNRSTREETQASTEAYALYQTIKTEGVGGIEGLQALGDGWLMLYDAHWTPTDGENAVYRIEVALYPKTGAAGSLYALQCVAKRQGGGVIYRLDTQYYLPGTGGDAL